MRSPLLICTLACTVSVTFAQCFSFALWSAAREARGGLWSMAARKVQDSAQVCSKPPLSSLLLIMHCSLICLEAASKLPSSLKDLVSVRVHYLPHIGNYQDHNEIAKRMTGKVL